MKNHKTLIALIFFCTSIMYTQQIELVKRPLDVPTFTQYGTKYKMGELVHL